MEVNVVAELIYRKYSSGDPSADSGLELVDFEHAVRQYRAYKIRTDYFNTFRITGAREITTGWLQEYKNVPVLLDPDTNGYYSMLPTQPISLPHDLGMYFISPMKNFQAPFMIQTIGESFIFEANPKDNIVFNYDNTKVYYENFDPSIKNVYMQIVPLSSDNIPDEFVAEISEAILKSFNSARGLLDKVDDNNPNTNHEEVASGKQ